MKRVPLGNQGLTVSAQGLGCMGMSTTYGPSDEHESLATLARALDLGITFFDTAEVYGPFLNETLLGKAFDEVAPTGAAAGERYSAGMLEAVGH